MSIVQKQGEDKYAETTKGIGETLFVSKQKHRVQQRSILTPEMAYIFGLAQAMADIEKKNAEDPEFLMNYGEAIHDFIDSLEDHILNLLVSTEGGRGRKDGVAITSAFIAGTPVSVEQVPSAPKRAWRWMKGGEKVTRQK